MDPATLTSIENTNRRRRRLSPTPFTKDLPSPRELLRLSKHCGEEEEKNENNDHDHIRELVINSNIRSSITLTNSTKMESEFPGLSSISPIKKKWDHDHQDSSFQTQETVPESDSEDSSPSSSFCSKQLRFADEVGLPIQSIVHYECTQDEHSELVVLCLCPVRKNFEFLHVGYHGATLKDLLAKIPGLCTNKFFGESKFSALYRSSGLSFANLCEEPCEKLTLRECGFRENEVVVAAIEGSSERAVLAGIGPLLGNPKILKTLKRARRSRRGLKFVRGKDEEMPYHLQKRRDLSLRRKSTIKKKDELAIPKIEPELVDEYCRDYDPLYDVTEYHKQLLRGILAVGAGTIVLSALGL